VSHAAYWAGIPCAVDSRAPIRWTAARGLEPATATIAVPRGQLSTLLPEEPDDPFALSEPTSPALIGALNSSTPRTEGGPVPMPFVGDLLVVQDDGDDSPRVILHQRQMYFAGATVPDPEHHDRTFSGSDPIVMVQLVGIQDFWDDYGEITEVWNQLRGTAEPRAAADFRGAVEAGTQAPADELRYTATTSLEGGRYAKPLRDVVQACLDALPGQLQIARWPEVFLPAVPPPPPEDLRGWGASPKEIVLALCGHYGLHPHVGPDLGVRFYKRGEGVIGETAAEGTLGDDNTAPHDPETGSGAWSDAVVADRYLRRSTRRPDQVLVVGDRTIMDAAVDWCRPVLYYQEVPDQASGRKPPAPVVLEVRPENLARIASGQAPSEAEADDELSTFLLSLAATDAAGFVNPFRPVEGTPPPELTRLTWQRLVLVGNDDERWHEVMPGLSEPVRDLLQAQLGWVYQVPPEFRRLLPLANRAAVDHRGERLPIMVEAYGFRALRSRERRQPKVTNPDELDLPGAAEAAEIAARKEATDKLAQIRREIEEDQKRIKLLKGPTSEELTLALSKVIQERKAAGLGFWDGFVEALPSLTALALESLAQDKLGADPGVGYAIVDAIRSDGESAPIFTDDAEAAEVFFRVRNAEHRLSVAFLRRFGLEGLFGVPPEILDNESVQGVIREIEERIERAEENYRKAELELNTKLARQNELASVEAELARIRAQMGREARELRNRALKLQDEIEKLQDEEAKALEQEEKEVEVVTHVNLARRSVPYTVLDAALGIIRINTPTPPVWLANPAAADPAETFAYFMPVRITFGTTNGLDQDGVPEERPEGPSNPYLRQWAEAVAEVPEMRELLGVIGHVLPSPAGERSTRFGFTRADMSGDAKIDRHRARRITVRSTPPFRELVELGGRTNREKLRKRARALAAALLDRPKDVPDGSLTLRGPRLVLCNGVISATEVRWIGDAGFVTEVSFHVDTEPLPGVEGASDEPEPYRMTFGLDVEASRDR
jgi:hypothetical protein